MIEQTAITQLYKIWLSRDLTTQDFYLAKEIEKEQMINFARNMPMETGINKDGKPIVIYNSEEYYSDLYEITI
jgi:hypothetical protein